jgi:hypothetical protein
MMTEDRLKELIDNQWYVFQIIKYTPKEDAGFHNRIPLGYLSRDEHKLKKIITERLPKDCPPYSSYAVEFVTLEESHKERPKKNDLN